MTKDCLWSL